MNYANNFPVATLPQARGRREQEEPKALLIPQHMHGERERCTITKSMKMERAPILERKQQGMLYLLYMMQLSIKKIDSFFL